MELRDGKEISTTFVVFGKLDDTHRCKMVDNVITRILKVRVLQTILKDKSKSTNKLIYKITITKHSIEFRKNKTKLDCLKSIPHLAYLQT